MKKAAHVVNEKKLNLMPLDQLKQVTGYVRGMFTYRYETFL